MSSDMQARSRGDVVAPPSSAEFRAFISYAHSDAKHAARLQKRLETYRLPRRLRERSGGIESSGRVGRVFRDREDLSAAADLSEAVKAAIAASGALVVVCTPAAAHSRWVRREIELFQRVNPGRPILAALFEGEPEDAFPALLVAGGTEPLAADFRPRGDGRRLAFLKVVAGLLDVPLDTLIQRDSQRRLRRVTAVTLLALMAMLILSAMTILASEARDEARRQEAAAQMARTDAEDLVDFMLTNLREQLRGVGRLDIMLAVNERALAYYEQQDVTQMDDDALRRRAAILQALGEDYLAREETDTARRYFQEAYETTEEVLSREGENSDAIFAHAQSEFWLGRIAWADWDRAETERHWTAYLDLAKRLQKLEPEQTRTLLELGYAHGNLCDLESKDNHDLAAAEQHCRDSLRYLEDALNSAPDDRTMRKTLANRHGWMGHVYYAAGRYDDAIASRSEEAAIMADLLREEPQNREFQERRLWAELGRARAEAKSGDLAASSERFDTAVRTLDRLIEEDPTNELWKQRRERALSWKKSASAQ
ncbi:hypothetical protein B5C34_13400 [Pacificimonas flava]|uniref:TIR domain-containing protein n=2 Tax=Pacificimonas TaxID=1960290 RepID=A0A219B843_9SPHN|nr:MULTISPECIES: toll/interleukin-1 receptor domain-containing protein [Pacificimonas]MBZ6379819.1 toll/interleukin-1 receptor domain-containing protein [Pacificimonas aurantium]OWV34354.1 hypothetical protein B5C34_13400 [Pacificimonas flava]